MTSLNNLVHEIRTQLQLLKTDLERAYWLSLISYMFCIKCGYVQKDIESCPCENDK